MSQPEKKCPRGLPAWMATFADLMSLLMCFFVLLLSFSELDVQKYKQIAGSLKFAFGVQREIKTEEIPKGTSIVAKEFSPGKPQPTVLKVMHQQTTDQVKRDLDFTESMYKTQADARKIKEKLDQEIKQKMVEVETREKEIVIRIQEKGSFPSGSATLKGSFGPIMDKIAKVLKETEGKIIISGHTDNIPISTERFRSNWELSAARAVSLLHELLKRERFDQSRMEVLGKAETNPLVANDSAANRAKNRRVEILIAKDSDKTATAGTAGIPLPTPN